MNMQPIIIPQGTIEARNQNAVELIVSLLETSNYPTHPDFKLLELPEGKKFIPIELVRELIKEINIKPRVSSKKVIWIKEAQSLSVEAQNALLKTLEEPPYYSTIILTADHSSNLIQTVLSRCVIRSLSLSARIDKDSAQFVDAKDDLLNIMSKSIGEKIDWITNNKEKLKSREEVLTLLDMWEVALRDQMTGSLKVSSADTNKIKDKIRLLQKVKKYIQSNANVALAIETLLINI